MAQWRRKQHKKILNLEKRHYRQGTVSRLKKSENDFATTDKEILHERESFFKDLYSSKMKTDSILPETDFFFSENDTVLSNEERDSIEGLLTELECLNALKDIETRQKPGNRLLAFWILPIFLEWCFQTSARSLKLRFRDRPAVYISITRYNKTYSQKEWRTLLYQKLEAAYTLKLRL